MTTGNPHSNLPRAMEADENGEVRGFMCRTDWECEIGAACGGSRVFPSLEALKTELNCTSGCGIVEVAVRCVRLVEVGTDNE